MKLFRSTVILFATLLATVPAMAQKPCCKTGAQHFADSVSRGKALYGSGFGVLAVRVGGDTIACINPHKRLLPASNNKLISTGLALVELGPEFRFPTSIAYSGSIKDGVLEGDLYIVGGGDPTIASGDSISLEANQLFSVWKKFIDDAGIREIHGRVIGDGRYFDGMYIPGSWQYTDLGTYYGTGGNGLSFYRNVKSFNVTAGKNVGDPVTVVDSYPDTPWMTYTNESTTGESGTGDELYLYTSELAPVGIMRGTFAVDRRPKTEECSNMFPALTCAWYFTNFLKGNGLRVSGEAADIGQDGKVRTTPTICTGLYPAAEEMTVIGTSYSPTIEQIARITNWRSDNYYAETLYRMIGRKNAGSADYEACQMAEYQALERLGLCTEEINIEDGSGLSRHPLCQYSLYGHPGADGRRHCDIRRLPVLHHGVWVSGRRRHGHPW